VLLGPHERSIREEIDNGFQRHDAKGLACFIRGSNSTWTISRVTGHLRTGTHLYGKRVL
jgi:hypothetical protein